MLKIRIPSKRINVVDMTTDLIYGECRKELFLTSINIDDIPNARVECEDILDRAKRFLTYTFSDIPGYTFDCINNIVYRDTIRYPLRFVNSQRSLYPTSGDIVPFGIDDIQKRMSAEDFRELQFLQTLIVPSIARFETSNDVLVREYIRDVIDTRASTPRTSTVEECSKEIQPPCIIFGENNMEPYGYWPFTYINRQQL